MGFPGGSVVKNQPVNAGDAGFVGSIPGREDSLEEEMAIRSSIHAWKIPWTEEPDGLTPWSWDELDMTEHTHTL